MNGLVLDSLQPDLDVERRVAAEHGARIERWDGNPKDLSTADLVLHVRTKVDRPLIDLMSACRAIGRFGTGLDTVDREAASERGIAVVRVPDYGTREVALHAVALTLSVARGIASLRETEPAAAWERLRTVPRIGLDGPIGVVGFGAIGQAATQMFKGLGLDVLVATGREDVDFERLQLVRESLDALLEKSEAVSLHTALADETKHLIGTEQIARMRRDAILVNTARAGLVDAAALIAALEEGQLRGVGLDAFEGEDGQALQAGLAGRELNVVTTPHIAWYSPASMERLRREAVARTIDAAKGRLTD